MLHCIFKPTYCLYFSERQETVFTYSNCNMMRMMIVWSKMFVSLFLAPTIAFATGIYRMTSWGRKRSVAIKMQDWNKGAICLTFSHNFAHLFTAVMKHLVGLWCPSAQGLSQSTCNIIDTTLANILGCCKSFLCTMILVLISWWSRNARKFPRDSHRGWQD